MESKEFKKHNDEDINFGKQLKAFTSTRLKAPMGFTESVMNSIYKLRKAEPDTAGIGVYFTRLYKNLGTSLVLASIIMILSFFIPKLNFYQPFISDMPNSSTMQQASVIKKNLAGMNTNINNILTSINRSVARFKEGT